MATSLDLQEQEQLDALKAFWNQHGNLITWVLVVALAAFAGWNAWNWYQRDQGQKAGSMFDELDRAAQAGDAERAGRIFGDLKERFAGAAYTAQGGLLAARVQYDKGQADAARASLAWVAEKAGEPAIRAVAALRLAGLQAEAKQFDAALKTLEGARAEGFDGLVADRRADVLMLQGKKAEALAAYQAAWAAMDDKLQYRQLVGAKLTALGAPPGTAASAAATTSPAGPAASAAPGASR